MSRAVPGARTLRAVRFLAGLLLAAAASGCMKGEVGGLLPPRSSPTPTWTATPRRRR